MCHYNTLGRAHHSFLNRYIGCRKNIRIDYLTSYLDTLMKTSSGSIEAIMGRDQNLSTGFVACMEDTRLPKCVVLKQLMDSGK